MFFTIVIFFLVLGVLVLVHEWGHFITARRAGIKVDEFGFGLPPRIIGFYKDEQGRWRRVGIKTQQTNNTIWSLNYLPLGGFVKIKGEQGESANDVNSFASKGVWRRIWVISAGVLMNLVLAAVLLSIGFGVGVPQFLNDQNPLPASAQVNDQEIRVIEVLTDGPAAVAGLKTADTILSIDGQSFVNTQELQDYLANKEGIEILVMLQRGQETLALNMTPQIITETNKPGIGVALVETALVSYPWYLAIWYGVTETIKMVGGVIFAFYLILKGLIVEHHLIGEVYGPVGIATLVGDAARLGFLYLLQFTAVLSIIIAVINFLPFPALDGGRVLFLAIEGLRGKPVNAKFENAMHNTGFALLMILLLVVTFRDIARLSSGLLGWFNKISNLF